MLLRARAGIENSHAADVAAMVKTHRDELTEQDIEALQRYDEKGGKYPKDWSELGPRYQQ